jgi:hypothetical protein
MHSRPGRKTKDSGRRMSPDPIIADARVWIVGTIVLFLLSFAAVRWLPDLMTRSPHSVSKSTAGSSTLTSEVRTTSLEQSDSIRSVTPNPLIPIVIRRSTSPDAEVSALPAHTEISSPQVSVPESVNTLPPRSRWIFAKSKMPSVSNNDLLISNFYPAQLMEFGVRARAERCESSGLLTALARAIPGTKLHKNGCLGHET